jgi:hypothetical protein
MIIIRCLNYGKNKGKKKKHVNKINKNFLIREISFLALFQIITLFYICSYCFFIIKERT